MKLFRTFALVCIMALVGSIACNAQTYTKSCEKHKKELCAKEKKCDKTAEKCDKACDKATKKCDKACDKAAKKCDKACDKTAKKCDKACDKAAKKCQKKCDKH